MEDILDLYAAPPDPARPLICMDEASKQLTRHERPPEPCAAGRPSREDYHYERRGVQALFCFLDPHAGWRRVSCGDSRTAVDWACEVRRLLEEDYPQAERVRLVCDNLNTHTEAALYEAFEPEVARRLARRLEVHYTPVHGSWLNVAEVELSVLAGQCLDRRIDSAEALRAEVAAWQAERNAARCGVLWQFTTEDARTRLRHLYPPL